MKRIIRLVVTVEVDSNENGELFEEIQTKEGVRGFLEDIENIFSEEFNLRSERVDTTLASNQREEQDIYDI